MINKDYEKWLINLKEKWFGNVEKWLGKYSNYFISPANLDYYWHNKGSQKEKREVDSENSPGNRSPNYFHRSKRIMKISYLIGQVCYAQDYNQLPVSIIYATTNDEKKYDNPLAKDRGTNNFYISKREDEQSISVWRGVLSRLEKVHSEEYIKENKRLQKTIIRIKELIKGKKPFSIISAVPTNIWDEWWNDEEFIAIRIKFESYNSHTSEMERMQDNDNKWIWFKHIMSNGVTPLIHNYPSLYTADTLDNIYNHISAKLLFQGSVDKIMTNIPNQTTEEYENVIPWYFTGAINAGVTTEDLVKNLARDSEKERDTLKSWCVQAFKGGEGAFKDNSDYMELISKSKQLEKFIKDRDKWVKGFYSNTPKDKQKQNILLMKVGDWRTFLICCYDIVTICNKIHKGNVNDDRMARVADTYFRIVRNKVNNDELEVFDSKLSTTYKIRYEYFLKDVREKTFMESENSKDYDVQILKDILIEDIEEEYSLKNYKIYDRKSSKNFPIMDIKIETNKLVGLEEGHCDGSDVKKFSNIILQPKLDNKYNDNHPIDDVEAYAEKYLQQLKEYLGDDLNPKIYEKTEILLNSWKNQIEVESDD